MWKSRPESLRYLRCLRYPCQGERVMRLTRDARECILPTQHIGRSAYTNMEDDDLQVNI